MHHVFTVLNFYLGFAYLVGSGVAAITLHDARRTAVKPLSRAQRCQAALAVVLWPLAALVFVRNEVRNAG